MNRLPWLVAAERGDVTHTRSHVCDCLFVRHQKSKVKIVSMEHSSSRNEHRNFRATAVQLARPFHPGFAAVFRPHETIFVRPRGLVRATSWFAHSNVHYILKQLSYACRYNIDNSKTPITQRISTPITKIVLALSRFSFSRNVRNVHFSYKLESNFGWFHMRFMSQWSFDVVQFRDVLRKNPTLTLLWGNISIPKPHNQSQNLK